MRQRKLKGLEEKLSVYSGGRQIDPAAQKGKWNEFFERDQPIYMELGCGKGQFILSLAKAFPERNFIAVEGNASVMLRALQKAARFFCEFSDEDLRSPDGSEKPFEEAVNPGIFAAKTKSESELLIDDANDPKDLQGGAGADKEAIGTIYAAAPNLIFANMYIREVTDCFAENELSGIYLNFSDPWPKAVTRSAG